MFAYYLDLAIRSLKRNRLLTVLMVLAIAIGIGASMTTHQPGIDEILRSAASSVVIFTGRRDRAVVAWATGGAGAGAARRGGATGGGDEVGLICCSLLPPGEGGPQGRMRVRFREILRETRTLTRRFAAPSPDGRGDDD